MPPLEEESSVVELNVEHLLLCGRLQLSQIVANLSRSCSPIVPAIAELSQLSSPNHSIVSVPDKVDVRPTALRIFVRSEPPIPSTGTVRPGNGQSSIEAYAMRDGPHNGPPDFS